MKIKNILELIGNTPLLLIPEEIHGVKNLELWCKLEMTNPFGSLKDRTALALIQEELESLIAEDKTIIEASSGNTARALQSIASLSGLKTKIISSTYKVNELKEILQLLGGELEEVDAASDCFDAEDPEDPYYLIKQIVEKDPDKFFRAGQFDRQENVNIHRKTTGKEIVDDLGKVDLLFHALGSSGSSQGITEALREANPKAQCIGIAGAPNDSIPGVMKIMELESAAKASMLFTSQPYATIEEVTELDALNEMLTLIRKVGIQCGPSSGANLCGVKQYFRKNPHPEQKAVAVFVACDRVEHYLSYIKKRLPQIFTSDAETTTISSFRFSGDKSEIQIHPSRLSDFQKDPEAVIIDIRSTRAAQMKPCPGALNIPLAHFESLLETGKPFGEGQKILLVCSIGEKTIHHAAYLRHMGYEAYSLENGMRGLALSRNSFFQKRSALSSPEHPQESPMGG